MNKHINLCITTSCNKNCSFCFAKKTNEEMDIKLVEKLLIKFPELEYFKILGGEPSVSSNFIDILHLLSNNNKNISIISNLLFNDNIRNDLLNALPLGSQILSNFMELDKNNIELFKKNYTKLSNKFILIPALTITEYHTEEYFNDYCDLLIENRLTDFFGIIRIGLDLSGSYFIKNTNIGKIVNVITKKLLKKEYTNRDITFDCFFPPCVFDYKEEGLIDELEKYKLLITHNTNIDYCGNLPFDLLPSGEILYCYPLKDKINLKNIFEYNTIQEAKEEVINKYHLLMNDTQTNKDCLECKYFNVECKGPCLSCLK